ncbi:hypothetical protein HXX76_016095 [Chlamydomonas incerta]|uniref:Uncharacterized protein n=1 Tax=Chlamydomonas incerta TaxID=51695 RepID=A0A835SKK7_CHLIN|nr:hypothetical protein HXX76_016095 [Chlamydomonas incerta]|eukprot:KAG2422370.1 hypothetical protein HXX76_016095 [Chlamydomonas incerta]
MRVASSGVGAAAGLGASGRCPWPLDPPRAFAGAGAVRACFPRTQLSPIGGDSPNLGPIFMPSRTQRASRSAATSAAASPRAAIGGGSGSRRRALIRRRPQPRGSARRRRRYRDEAGLLPDMDTDSPRFPGRLTTELGSANGPLQLAALLAEYGAYMSGPQVALALGRLAAFASFQALSPEQLAAHRRAARRCCLLLLQPGLGGGGGGSSLGAVGLAALGVAGGGTGSGEPRPRLAECEPLSLARASYALGRLGLYDSQLLELLVQESGTRLHLFAADALAALLGGLAALGHRPPAQWWDRYSLEVYARFGLFSCQELAVLLYGCARLSYNPSPAWAARALEAYRAAAAAPYAPPLPAAGVKFAFALATLQIRPSFNWLGAFMTRARPHLDALSARELAVLLWALSRLLLPHTPPPPAPHTQHAAGSSGAGNTPDANTATNTATAVSGAAGSSYLQLLDRVWLDAWLRCTARRLPGASAAALVLALQALAVLQVYPLPSKFSAALLDRVAEVLPPPALPPQQQQAQQQQTLGASGVMGALTEELPYEGGVSLGELDDDQQLQAGAGAGAEAGGARLSGAEVVSVLLSLVALRVRPGPDWMEACLAALEPQLRVLPPPMLLELAWALARLRYQPAKPWVAALLGALGAARAGLSAAQLGLLAWALAQMQVKAAGALQKLLSPHKDMVSVAGAGGAAAGPGTGPPDYAAGPAAARAVVVAVAPGAASVGATASSRGTGPARKRGSGGASPPLQDAAGAGAGGSADGGGGRGGGPPAGLGGYEAGLQAKLLELMGAD